jgi:hypothetical protein
VLGAFWYSAAVAQRGGPSVNLNAYRPAPAAADLQRVATTDQGIDFQGAARGGVYPLQEMSSSRPITADGVPVYVTADGTRVEPRLLFRDDFASPTSGWDSARAGWYEDGAYRVVTATSGGGYEYARHGQQLSDFFARVDARLDRPTQRIYVYLGFRFRHHPQGSDGYVFVVNPDDTTFRLELWQQVDGRQRRTPLIPDTPTRAVYEGTALNRLGVRADGPEILLFVNGQLVGRAHNDTYQSGGLALGVGVADDALSFAHGDARFSNLAVTAVN